MVSDWIEAEFTVNNFSDKRHFDRFKTMMSSFVSRLHGTIPKICKKKSEIKGAYRFFENENVTMKPILDSHINSLKQRIKEHKIVLNIQDSSTLNFYKHKSKKDQGGISYGYRGKGSSGYWLHAGLVFSTTGIPLGVTSQALWARKKLFEGETRTEHKKRLLKTPIKDKESVKWLNACNDCEPLLETGCDIVQIADREADIYEFMSNCKKNGFSFIIRSKSNRAICATDTKGNKCRSSLIKYAKETGYITAKSDFQVIGNSERKSKKVQISIKANKVTLLPPINQKLNEDEGGPIEATVVSVESKEKINGKPIYWRLLTDRHIETQEELKEIVRWYTIRWQIEVFFKTLKSGCQIEASRLTNLDRLSPYLAMKSIAAYRVMILTNHVKSNPQVSAFEVITKEEWSFLRYILYEKKRIPKKPRLKDLVCKIAELGGFISGGNRLPGIITIWRGWEEACIGMSVLQRARTHNF